MPAPDSTPLTIDTVRHAADHFAVFGLARSMSLDAADLERRFSVLARETHPDLVGDDAAAQIEALELSSRVNEAHRVLTDEESRADYLLVLLGGKTREQDKSLPDGFLPIIMITREELAEAQLEGDAAKVAEIEADARAQRTARLREIARHLPPATPAPGPEDLRLARMELNALRYYQRLLEQLHPDHREL
jgi:curved DNA-binding protein CbpA